MCRYKNTNKFREIEENFVNQEGLPFKKLLSEEEIRERLEKENIKYRSRVFSPVITLWAFLSQVLDKDHSCRKATSRVLAFFASLGKLMVLTKNSAYCHARARLKEDFLKKLTIEKGKEISQNAQIEHLYKGRRLKVIDGSSVTGEDTKANQKVYHQSPNQKEGAGFPIIQIGILFCLATGAVLEVCYSPLNVSEKRLFRIIYESLEPGDILLGDRGCLSYADIYNLKKRGIDLIIRVDNSKKIDFSKGKRLGKYEHIDTWVKPNYHKDYAISKEEHNLLPEKMEVRQIKSFITEPGFRTQKIVLLTTLLDYQIYLTEDIVCFNYRRWDAEINLRHLKTTMKMEHIASKTPSMVRKQIWVHLLAYNLIRGLMLQAAVKHNVDSLNISFKGTIDHVKSFAPQLAKANDSSTQEYILQSLFWTIATDLLPKRIGRIYDRRIKRRKKNFGRLTRTRKQYRKEVLDKYFGELYS